MAESTLQKESLGAELWGRNAHIDRLQKEIENILYGSAKEVSTVVFYVCGRIADCSLRPKRCSSRSKS